MVLPNKDEIPTKQLTLCQDEFIEWVLQNTEEDTEGCILLGMKLGVLVVRDEDSGEKRKKLAVLSSKVAFGLFMAGMVGEDEAELMVTQYGGSL